MRNRPHGFTLPGGLGTVTVVYDLLDREPAATPERGPAPDIAVASSW